MANLHTRITWIVSSNWIRISIRRSIPTTCCRQPSTSPIRTTNGTVRIWPTHTPNSACWDSTRAICFLKGLSRYGTELEKNLPRMDLTPIQTGFKFQRVNNWGGFVNKKVFFVRFTKDFELVKRWLWIKKDENSKINYSNNSIAARLRASCFGANRRTSSKLCHRNQWWGKLQQCKLSAYHRSRMA